MQRIGETDRRRTKRVSAVTVSENARFGCRNMHRTWKPVNLITGNQLPRRSKAEIFGRANWFWEPSERLSQNVLIDRNFQVELRVWNMMKSVITQKFSQKLKTLYRERCFRFIFLLSFFMVSSISRHHFETNIYRQSITISVIGNKIIEILEALKFIFYKCLDTKRFTRKIQWINSILNDIYIFFPEPANFFHFSFK